MELSGAVQESLLCILCFDDDQKGSQLVKALVPPQQFDKFYRELAVQACKYIDQYKKAPGEHTLDLIDSLSQRDPGSKDTYRNLWQSMVNTNTGINRDYVLANATNFMRYQRCKSIASRAVETLNSDTEQCVDEAEAIFSSVAKPLSPSGTFGQGLVLNDPLQALAFLNRDEAHTFRIGIKEFDRLGIGPFRGGACLYLAPGNTGKSHACVHVGKWGLLSRARVLHITCEMDKDQVAQRYIQSLFSVTRREAQKVVTERFDCDRSGRFTGIDKIVIKDRPSLKDKDILRDLRKKVIKFLGHRPKLVIREFSSGSLTVDRLKATLDYLENTEKFIPDILIVDYPELMKLDASNLRIDIGRTHVELRGIAQERRLAGFWVAQTDVSGHTAKRVQIKNIAENKAIYNTADIVFSYSQTEAEAQRGLARLESLKVRNEQKNMTVLLSQAYAMGQFCVDSTLMSSSAYWSEIGGQDDGE